MPACRWLRTGPTWKPSPGPRPPKAASAPTPKPPGGHRKNNLPGPKDELFFGYYLPAAITMPGEGGPAVPGFARRATLCSCRDNPVRALVPVLTAMPAAGIPPGDILAGSGYAHRDAAAWSVPLRAAGAQLIQDLHPHDRGPKGTRQGAIISNGNLYCPKTPRPLLEPGPPARDAAEEQAAAHDAKTAELARYKPGRITRDDDDGYHRVTCPAAMGKIRCPLRPDSMTLTRDRPEILTPPGHPPACCAHQTITVPPQVAAKTRQKHDYPSACRLTSRAEPWLFVRSCGGVPGVSPAHERGLRMIMCSRQSSHDHNEGRDGQLARVCRGRATGGAGALPAGLSCLLDRPRR